MKKIFFLKILFTLSILTIFSACEDNNDENPRAEITITAESEKVNLGENLIINYTVNSPIDIKTINILIDNRNVETISSFTTSQTHTGTYNFEGKIEYLNQSPIIQIEVIDIEEERSLKSINIQVRQSSESVPIVEYDNIILETQGISDAKQFLDADLARTFTLLQGKPSASIIDLVAFYDAEKKWVMAAPDDQIIRDYFTDEQNGTQTWSVRNRTHIKETGLTNRDFFAIIDGREIRAEYAQGGIPQGTDSQESFALQVNNLQEGYVFAFQTAQEKEGLIYISKIEGETAGRITISIKMVE
ncbi:hypothetical protein Fleli_0918 [Bernardetia litoralis DSM 6794]|uniref:Calx-beta domain-containing protein n=1 Tax=Bernardetia litoralis (strain ATCC 23117 / DSM 6794 / NBRC 15988 / NCIMB 1366 / Fx l1 / Sio-4) TaxID=880071 RepID=I4AHD7_BERLS|nr:hypothetical protein [Bernardetia litoralis]AFM03372.1 hypothetical protein Fleli_0918 [Bernardetia litoralis DSM 6794]